jgi:hypothetical protein
MAHGQDALAWRRRRPLENDARMLQVILLALTRVVDGANPSTQHERCVPVSGRSKLKVHAPRSRSSPLNRQLSKKKG